MKKLKLFFTIVTVLTVVSGAVAFKTVKGGGNLYHCNTQNVCALDAIYNSISGAPVMNPGNLYVPTSIAGATCGQPGCNIKFTGQVFIAL